MCVRIYTVTHYRRFANLREEMASETEIGFYTEDLRRLLHLGRRKAMAWNSDTGNVGWEACSLCVL